MGKNGKIVSVIFVLIICMQFDDAFDRYHPPHSSGHHPPHPPHNFFSPDRNSASPPPPVANYASPPPPVVNYVSPPPPVVNYASPPPPVVNYASPLPPVVSNKRLPLVFNIRPHRRGHHHHHHKVSPPPPTLSPPPPPSPILSPPPPVNNFPPPLINNRPPPYVRPPGRGRQGGNQGCIGVFTSVQGCVSDLIRSYFEDNIYVGSSCCRQVNGVSDTCFDAGFSQFGNPSYRNKIQQYCLQYSS